MRSWSASYPWPLCVDCSESKVRWTRQRGRRLLTPLPRPEPTPTPTRTCGTFDLRGEVLPYIDLALFYGMVPDATPADQSAELQRRSLVVVRDGSVRVGLVVDRLLGEHQTVIKPLAGIFRHLKALAGSTILGSGDVALVLDRQGLMAAALQANKPARHTASTHRSNLSE